MGETPRSKHVRYNATEKGRARNLRAAHGLSQEDSIKWSRVLLRENTCCAICGLSNRILSIYRDKGPWPAWMGPRDGAGSGRGLQLDHIIPGEVTGGFRVLCRVCNVTRGANVFSDAEVLRAVRSKWEWMLGPRFLFWLNVEPGIGGRSHRSEKCKKRDAEYAIDQPREDQPDSMPSSGTSPSHPESVSPAPESSSEPSLE